MLEVFLPNRFIIFHVSMKKYFSWCRTVANIGSWHSDVNKAESFTSEQIKCGRWTRDIYKIIPTEVINHNITMELSTNRMK